MPAQEFPRVAIHDKRQGGPTLLSSPDTAQVGGPWLVWPLCNRWKGFYARPSTNGPFAHLPALDLEDAPHSVFVEPEKPGDGAISERRLFLDQRLDGLNELIVQLWRGLRRFVIDRAARDIELGAQFRHWHDDPIVEKALLDAADHLSSSASSKAWSFFLARSSNIASP